MEADVAGRPRRYFFDSLFFQFDLQLGGLSSLYSYGHCERPGEGLHRHELVVAGRNVADSEFAIGAGDRVVGVVHHVDPAFHPAMRVAVDADRSGALQLDGDSLSLIRQGQVEGGPLTVKSMRVVEHRVAVDDVQPTWRNELNFRFETAFDIVKLGRLALLRPSLSLGDVDEVYDRALDSLIGANPDQRLLAGA